MKKPNVISTEAARSAAKWRNLLKTEPVPSRVEGFLDSPHRRRSSSNAGLCPAGSLEMTLTSWGTLFNRDCEVLKNEKAM
ncbi:MAG: hypothetical protein NTX52_07930 [Planctomycetota bacterium]|nr:hypothetical protein [Planctomycetota bacterium]